MKWFNKEYFGKGYTSQNCNMKAIAYILDSNIWTDKFKGDGIDYVVGGPSLDMIFDSYNQFTNQNSMYQTKATSAIGYQFSEDGGITWNHYSSNTSKFLTQNDELYRISSQNNAIKYWTSSPSAFGSDHVIGIGSLGTINYYGYQNTDLGFRPIACLKSNVNLKEIESGKSYKIN